jgi:hypothetical protein
MSISPFAGTRTFSGVRFIEDLFAESARLFGYTESHEAPTMDGVLKALDSLIPAILSIAYIGMLLWAIRECATDARRRGKSPVLVTLLVLFFFPLGLILWLLFRPDPTNSAGSSFRLEDHRVQ